MISAELLIPLGLFVVQLVLAIYLIRYSNQQLMSSISNLRDKNMELMKLNARLTNTVMKNERSYHSELTKIKEHHATKHKKKEKVAAKRDKKR
jgi:hypothetical protein